MKDEELLSAAVRAREHAHSPYSGFMVGAAVLTRQGNVYTGCNVENHVYNLTNCAERTAIFNAVSAGETEIMKLAVTADSEQPVQPCGACLQVMAEFGVREIILGNLAGAVKKFTLPALLPNQFQAADLAKED